MHKYLHKYLKYKSKYINLIHGGVQTPEKPKISSWASVVRNSSLPPPPSTPLPPPPSTPLPSSLPPPPSTPPPSTPPQPPQKSIIQSFTPESTVATPSTPKLEFDSIIVDRLKKNQPKLIESLQQCKLDYDISSNAKKDFFINFRKDLITFAHFSFHNPKEDSLKLGDMYDTSPFHLRLDSIHDIIFNLERTSDDQIILQSKMKEEEIIDLIGCKVYYELIKIKNCLEKVLNTPELKKILFNPVAQKLDFTKKI
jgi:hypothetical protein